MFGLKKIEDTKDYYRDTDGKVYRIQEIKPYNQSGCSATYRVTNQVGKRIYVNISITNEVIEDRKEEITKVVTAPKKQLTEEEIRNMIFQSNLSGYFFFA